MAALVGLKPVVVEFVGLPGAGKSTVAGQVLATLTARGYRCLDRRALIALQRRHPTPHRIAYLEASTVGRTLAQARLLAEVLAYGLRVVPLNRESVRRSLKLYYRLALWQRVSLADYDVVLLDQFFLQDLWSIAVSGNPPPERHLNTLLQELSRLVPFKAVLLEVDAATALARIRERRQGTSRFDRMQPSRAEGVLSASQRYLDTIVSRFARLDGAQVLRVDARQGIDETARQVAAFIEQHRSLSRPEPSEDVGAGEPPFGGVS